MLILKLRLLFLNYIQGSTKSRSQILWIQILMIKSTGWCCLSTHIWAGHCRLGCSLIWEHIHTSIWSFRHVSFTQPHLSTNFYIQITIWRKLTWHLKASNCSLRSWTSLMASFCFSWISECARLDLVLWGSSREGAVEEEVLGLRSRTCVSGGLKTADLF